MMPPPQMTTSALSMPEHSPELEDELEGGERRDVPVVERGRHLHDVEADQPRVRGRDPQQVERLPCGQPAGGRNLCSGREGGIESVDVERNVDVLARQRISDRARGSVAGRE